MSRLPGERRLQHAAALLLEREVVPGPAPVPDFATLLAARARRARLRRGGLALAAVAALTAGAALRFAGPGASQEASHQAANDPSRETPLAAFLASFLATFDPRPVSYVVAGGAVLGRDGVEAMPSPAAPARLRFSEGTQVTLTSGSRLTVAQRTRHGALLELEHGQAHLRVVHRRGARWSVVAGPFVVEVTGTEFTVDWSPRAGRMVVELAVGAVRVKGPSVGGAVELHAGERLVASASDGRLTLGPSGGPGAADDSVAAARADGPGMMSPPAPSRVVIAAGSGAARARLPARPLLALRTPQQVPPPATPEIPELPVPVLDGSLVARPVETRGPRLDPLPVEAPSSSSIPQSLTMGGGGLFCVTVRAQYSFEDAASGLSAPGAYTLALSRPRIDRTHSWCGEASVRMDASFDESGRRNFFGRFANETGQLVVRLDRPTDLTGKTVTMHVYVEGPPDARFTAEIAAVQRGGWASGPAMKELAPGRWWTISHRFDVENPTGVRGSSNPFPYPNGGVSSVAETDRLALAIHATGDRRAWKGAVYVDDISW